MVDDINLKNLNYPNRLEPTRALDATTRICTKDFKHRKTDTKSQNCKRGLTCIVLKEKEARNR